jgi:hypothetical protein
LTRLLGFGDDLDPRDGDPDTLRYRAWRIPTGLARAGKQTDTTPETGRQHNQ